MADSAIPHSDLTGDALLFWEAVTASYQLRPDEARILADACREIDLIERINQALKPKANGQHTATSKPMVKGSMGQQVVNPLFQEVRQHRLALASLLKQLKLPSLESENGAGEKPAATDASANARRAAMARWGTRG